MEKQRTRSGRKSGLEAPDASATIAICCGKYCNGGNGGNGGSGDRSGAILNAAPTQRRRFASGEG
ncbi:hypothetical protein QFZ94_004950 [Paraburkholderia sp. JPY465]|uniref:hypothetical protein n=1 Tax=Paraburkholderia sp. JPY465 TaxID=3042285 RepID=UPI003D1B74CA